MQVCTAFLILVPAAADLSNPCYYADGGGSLTRWAYCLRGILSMLSLALKLCDVRILSILWHFWP